MGHYLSEIENDKAAKLDRSDRIIKDVEDILHRHISRARTEIKKKIRAGKLDVNCGVMVQTSVHKHGLRDGFNNCLWPILGGGDGEIYPKPEHHR